MRVLRRVAQLFDRYAFVHGEMAFPGFSLLDADGRLFGMVERIALTNGQLVAEGWALADEVGLTGADQSARRVPDRPRDDVLAAHSLASGTPGFALALTPKGGQIGFWALRDGVRHVHPLPAPDGGLARKMRLRLLAPFMRDAIRALPAAARWYLRRDPVAIAQIKTILGLNVVPRARQLDTRLLAPAEAGVAAAPVTIILPVFNAFDLLPEVLDRVLRNTDLPWRLIVVEDCSTDPQVRPWLQRWLDGLGPDRDRVTLIENEGNQGFIRSVNRAFAAAITRRLAADGFRTVVLDIVDPDGPCDHFLQVDLSDLDAARAAAAQVAADHAVTCLVNNVGIVAPAPLEEVRAEDLDRLMHVNLRPSLICAQAFLPAMKAAGGGRIVMNTSRVTLGKELRSLYSATKGAAQSMARTWALELGLHGITVNCVAPGPIATDAFWKNNPPDAPLTRDIIAKVPVKRLGTGEDVANAVSFFCAPEAGFVTGQTLFVCGGVTVG